MHMNGEGLKLATESNNQLRQNAGVLSQLFQAYYTDNYLAVHYTKNFLPYGHAASRKVVCGPETTELYWES